ncbi:MAG: ATP-binding protein [Symploca sp. SIO1C2]|nr:ATP-binding protein [Symploca sp. SIO1C2]NER50537.1 ATP-binding protein [Symploca sp. SIO1A3]
MNHTFGDFIQAFPPNHDSLELSFTPTSERIKNRWRNQRLSAHFMADYIANFLPLNKNKPEEEKRIKEIKGAVSYIANELLENAMKFNLETSSSKVKLGVHFLDAAELIVAMFTKNSIDLNSAEKFQVFIQTLLASDPEELYIQQVEASAEDENAEMSGLGFLTMINDYQAKLGWKFEPLPSAPGMITVTTMAQVSV